MILILLLFKKNHINWTIFIFYYIKISTDLAHILENQTLLVSLYIFSKFSISNAKKHEHSLKKVLHPQTKSNLDIYNYHIFIK